MYFSAENIYQVLYSSTHKADNQCNLGRGEGVIDEHVWLEPEIHLSWEELGIYTVNKPQ